MSKIAYGSSGKVKSHPRKDYEMHSKRIKQRKESPTSSQLSFMPIGEKFSYYKKRFLKWMKSK
jgi:hypothetical protein